VEEMLHNIECEELLENGKRGFVNLETMAKVERALIR
jgi:hypothetical protein